MSEALTSAIKRVDLRIYIDEIQEELKKIATEAGTGTSQ